ncbi:inositol 1,4,5-triphosphate receptor associated 1-like isoform X5 [Polyodon spathula]|uniref:inositol 1,4,5-triphosphate receptor associated 1-like isoform X5 n=1 Tax=Polyodon spathula TaxID=7913 RepID=UPI001B7EFC2D|nr:inositol 1,4,5-triphosphate receptor associated 1-like isoform X5 [Polyodon spathula]
MPSVIQVSDAVVCTMSCHPWSRLVHQRSLSLSSLFTASPPQGDSPQTPTQSCGNEPEQKVSRETHFLSKEKLKQQHRDLDVLLSKVTAAGYKKNSSKMFNVTKEQAPEPEAVPGPCDSAERQGGSDDSDEDNCAEDLLPSSWDNLSILERLRLNSVQLTEEEIESAFTHLSLAFKCDQYTLRKRLQAEERAREVTEENIHRELEEGRATLQTLKALCLDSKRNEIIQQLEQSLEILANTIKRIASTAELLGAVHQEARVSHAVELMILHVENLKQHHVQELSELEEMKRLVQRNSRTRKFSEPQGESNMRQKLQHLRSTQQHSSRRRVSIAVIPKQMQVYSVPDGRIPGQRSPPATPRAPTSHGTSRQQQGNGGGRDVFQQLPGGFAKEKEEPRDCGDAASRAGEREYGGRFQRRHRNVCTLPEPAPSSPLQAPALPLAPALAAPRDALLRVALGRPLLPATGPHLRALSMRAQPPPPHSQQPLCAT